MLDENPSKEIVLKRSIKKIVLFGSLPSGFGGMEKVFIEFSTYFNQGDQYSVDFCMYELNNGQNDYGWLKEIPYQLYRPNTQFRLLQKIKIAHFFKSYLKKTTPDIVIAYDPLSVFLAKKAIRRSRLIIPLCSWLHFSFTRFKLKYQNYALMADYHLAICDTIKEQLVVQGASEVRSYVIYNPIVNRIEKILSPDKNKFTLLYVGRVQYQDQKNLKELFLALGKFNKPFILNIVGNGAEEDINQLKVLAKELNIQDKIHWHGWQDNPWSYVKENISAVSALVLTSTFEGFPMTLCEALSRGIFCISADCETGPRDILNSSNGLLYPPGDIDKLKECLDRVYDDRITVCGNTIQNSVSHLQAPAYFKRLDDIFRSILA